MANKANYTVNFVIGGKVSQSLGTSVKGAVKTLGGLAVGATAANLAWKGVKALTTTTVDFLKSSVESAKNYESAMADVAKVVDGLKDDAGNNTEAYTEMSDQILDLSTRVPKSAEDIAKIVEAAGQSNIESDQLIDFAESAVKMSVAFDTTAEQSGEWMAVWRTSMGLTQDEVEALADQVNYLGNTSSENALKISQVVTDVGSLGKISGLSAGEVAALAAATTGVDPSTTGTGIKNMIVAMSSGTSATKKQTAAFDKLGISTTKLANRMQTDAQGAILDVLDAINKLPGSEQTAVIKDIFGKTSLETVAKLAGNVENLRDQLDKINDPSLYTGSMDKEFEARSATYENQLILWQNTWEKFKINTGGKLLEHLNEISKTLLPEIDSALEEISPTIDRVIDSIDIGDLLSSAVDSIPTVANFITETLPLIPGALQSAIDLAERLMPLIEGVCNVIEIALAGLSLLTGNASAAEAMYDRKWANKVEETWSSSTPEQAAANKQQTQTRAEKATGATKTQSGTSIPTLPPGQKYSFGVGNAANATTTTAGNVNSPNKVTPFASGGIVTKPTFALIGEDGENEAVIPLSRLEQMLSNGGKTNNAMTYSITFSPTINVTTNGDASEIRGVMDEEYERFKQFMDQYIHDRDRVRF